MINKGLFIKRVSLSFIASALISSVLMADSNVTIDNNVTLWDGNLTNATNGDINISATKNNYLDINFTQDVNISFVDFNFTSELNGTKGILGDVNLTQINMYLDCNGSACDSNITGIYVYREDDNATLVSAKDMNWSSNDLLIGSNTTIPFSSREVNISISGEVNRTIYSYADYNVSYYIVVGLKNSISDLNFSLHIPQTTGFEVNGSSTWSQLAVPTTNDFNGSYAYLNRTTTTTTTDYNITVDNNITLVSGSSTGTDINITTGATYDINFSKDVNISFADFNFTSDLNGSAVGDINLTQINLILDCNLTNCGSVVKGVYIYREDDNATLVSAKDMNWSSSDLLIGTNTTIPYSSREANISISGEANRTIYDYKDYNVSYYVVLEFNSSISDVTFSLDIPQTTGFEVNSSNATSSLSSDFNGTTTYLNKGITTTTSDTNTTMSISPASKDFGTITIGQSSSQAFTITNSGATNSLSIGSSGVSVSDSTNYAISNNTCTASSTVSTSDTCSFTVTYTPTNTNIHATTVTIDASNTTSTKTIVLTGTGYQTTTTTTTTATSDAGGSVTGGTLDETASTETTSVVISDAVAVDTTTTSQTTSTVDDTAGTSEINVALTDTTTGTSQVQTEVKMSNTAKVEIQTDGSVKATEKAETGDTNAVTVSKNGNANLESTTKDKVKIKVNVPAGKEGAKVKTDAKTGKMTAETKLESKDTLKDVKISVEVDPTNKSSKTSIAKEAFPTAVIEQISGGNANIAIVTGAPSEAGVLDSSTDVLLENGTSRSLRATTTTKAIGVKTTFKSTRSFFASQKSTSRETDYSTAKTVEIIATTSWQKFEEIVLFDGKRSLKLLLGNADIIIDGKRSAMTQNEEYILPLQIEVPGGEVVVEPTPTPEPTTKPSTEAIYSDGKLSLVSGWNLISLPVDTTVDDMSIFGSYSDVWAYDTGAWSNPTTITKAQGFWIKMDSANEVSFSGSEYTPDVANLSSGWSLVGTGSNLTNFKSINSLEAVWSYQNGSWISDPETIYIGQGFWMKK